MIFSLIFIYPLFVGGFRRKDDWTTSYDDLFSILRRFNAVNMRYSLTLLFGGFLNDIVLVCNPSHYITTVGINKNFDFQVSHMFEKDSSDMEK